MKRRTMDIHLIREYAIDIVRAQDDKDILRIAHEFYKYLSYLQARSQKEKITISDKELNKMRLFYEDKFIENKKG
jgi:hypothetical protein